MKEVKVRNYAHGAKITRTKDIGGRVTLQVVHDDRITSNYNDLKDGEVIVAPHGEWWKEKGPEKAYLEI